MLKFLAARMAQVQVAAGTVGKIVAVNGNATYDVEIRGKIHQQVGSISGAAYRVGQTVQVIYSFGQVFLP